MTFSLRSIRLAICGAAAAFAIPASAADEGFELWTEPSVSTDLDEDTGIQIQTSQRFRDADDGRVDTYVFRLWLHQKVSSTFTLSGGVEQNVNDGGADETRFLQQVTGKHGIVRSRLRLEERLVNGTGRMGLRVRPRLGVSVPLGTNDRWSGFADAEGFITLKSTSVGGDDGFTGLRTRVGAKYAASDNLAITLAYLRQQDIRDNRPDRVGHVPLIGLDFVF